MKANKLILEIRMGNAAMQTPGDVAAALEATARKIREGRDSGKVMDSNGNSVGMFEFILS